MKLHKKQQVLIGITAAILVLGGGIYLWQRKQQMQTTPTPTTTKKKVSSPVNLIPVAERPFVRLEPSSDGHYISIIIETIKKPATNLEYEMEYQTGSMLQGFGGVINIGRLPVTERKLFGSQSAGGAITYHEDIQGGNLELQFGGSENYAVKSAWRYFTNTAKESKFSSQDTKFSITSPKLGDFAQLIVYNTPGFPEEINQALLSDPYSLSASRSLEGVGDVTVSIRHTGEGQIMGFDGETWQTLPTTFADNLNTATGPLMQVYILTEK